MDAAHTVEALRERTAALTEEGAALLSDADEELGELRGRQHAAEAERDALESEASENAALRAQGEELRARIAASRAEGAELRRRLVAEHRRLAVLLCRASREGDVRSVLSVLRADEASRASSPAFSLPRALDTPANIDDDEEDEFTEKASSCAVHYAAQHGNAEALEALLEAGADAEVQFHTLWASVPTPLLLAAGRGHAGCVEVLLARSADTEARQPPLQRTALHAAVAHGHAPIIAALLAGGASHAATDRDGDTPYGLALRRMRSVAPERDAWELERALVALGHRAPVSHEARMSGVDAGGNWAAGGDGARDLRKMAARSHAQLRECVVAAERPLRQLTAARQRLAWLRAARTRGCAVFALAPDLVEMVALEIGLPSEASALVASLFAADEAPEEEEQSLS